MPTQCIYEGDFYQCISAADVNQTPATNPEKWSRIQIPKKFRRVLARLTYAHLLELDGQKEKAIAEYAQGREQLEDLARDEANDERWRMRPHVGRHRMR